MSVSRIVCFYSAAAHAPRRCNGCGPYFPRPAGRERRALLLDAVGAGQLLPLAAGVASPPLSLLQKINGLWMALWAGGVGGRRARVARAGPHVSITPADTVLFPSPPLQNSPARQDADWILFLPAQLVVLLSTLDAAVACVSPTPVPSTALSPILSPCSLTQRPPLSQIRDLGQHCGGRLSRLPPHTASGPAQARGETGRLTLAAVRCLAARFNFLPDPHFPTKGRRPTFRVVNLALRRGSNARNQQRDAAEHQKTSGTNLNRRGREMGPVIER